MHPTTGLSLGRIVIGAAALASPEQSAKLAGLDSRSNRQLPYMTRMFASREVALGVVTLLSRGRTRRALAALGVAVDSADLYATYEARAKNTLPVQSVNLLGGATIAAIAAGALGVLVGNRRSEPTED